MLSFWSICLILSFWSLGKNKQECKSEAGEIAQSVEFLLHEHVGLSSDHQNPCRKPGTAVFVDSPGYSCVCGQSPGTAVCMDSSGYSSVCVDSPGYGGA